MRLRFPAELAAAVVVTIALCVPTNVLCGSTEAALYRESMEVSIEKGGYTNKLYFLTATLGSPPSEFKFCIDTGSSDTWVASTRCKSAGCSTLKKYDGRVSTSFVSVGGDPNPDNTISIQYGTGDATGYEAQETMSLGSPPITIRNQTFMTIVQLSESFYNSPCDGLMGLAFPNLASTSGGLPIFFNMIDQGLLDQPLFSVWLSSNPAASPAGAITFGAVNPAHYTGSIQYIPVNSRSFWKIPLGGARVNGQAVQLEATQALTDTGSEFIGMGMRDVKRLMRGISQAVYDENIGLYNVTTGCDDLTGLPNIDFQFGGVWLSVAPKYWVSKISIDEAGRARPQAAVSPQEASGIQLGCVAAIAPMDDTFMGIPMRQNSVIFGVPFLRAFYTVYRRNAPNDNSMGFAPAA